MVCFCSNRRECGRNKIKRIRWLDWDFNWSYKGRRWGRYKGNWYLSCWYSERIKFIICFWRCMFGVGRVEGFWNFIIWCNYGRLRFCNEWK